MDDGKVNALSPTMLDALGDALDRAENDDAAAVVLAGRPGRFSARVRPRACCTPAVPRPSACSSRLRARRAAARLPAARRHRLHRPRRGHGLVPAVRRRLPRRGRRRLHAPGQRGGHRPDHAARGGRASCATASPRRRSTAPSDWPSVFAQPTPWPPDGSIEIVEPDAGRVTPLRRSRPRSGWARPHRPRRHEAARRGPRVLAEVRAGIDAEFGR